MKKEKKERQEIWPVLYPVLRSYDRNDHRGEGRSRGEGSSHWSKQAIPSFDWHL